MERDVGLPAERVDPAEDGVVRVGAAADDVDDRQPHGEDDRSSTPATITPPAVTAAIASSTRSVLASSRQTAGSIRPIAAATITAPSTALGRSAIGPVRNRITSTIAPAAISPAIWLRAPMPSLTAVREPLAPTGIPWLTPAAALAAPMASSS